jgi:class 3 adenylate cyclase
MTVRRQQLSMTSPIDDDTAAAPLQRERRAIVVVDVVESVRLMQADEAGVIDRWRRFVNEVRAEVLAGHEGRLVKSLGDGMLLEFASVPPAIGAALDLHRRIAAYNHGRSEAAALLLRIGVHSADVVVDELDVYGAGVNLAARLAGLAGPGETVVSAEVRDALVPGLHAEVEDLGECYLKHLAEPCRAFRVGPAGAVSTVSVEPLPSARPEHSIAVVPLQARGGDAAATLYGELIADGVIALLSRNRALRVISRLSTSRLKGHDDLGGAVRTHLGASYVLSGSCVAHGEQLLLMVELADTRTQSVVWAERLRGPAGDLFSDESSLVHDIAMGAHLAMLSAEVQRMRTQPYPSLDSFSLLMGSISLLHRSSTADFQRAHDALTALAERAPRQAGPFAWKAMWHFLRLIRGLSPHPEEDRRRARQDADRALDNDASSAIALTLKGLVVGFLERDLAQAERLYEQALALNPSEALAWLFTCTLRSWQGRGAESAAAGERALQLSPLDPLRYYYDSLAAAGMLADRRYARAIELCERSLRANRLHTATHRVLIISQVLSGDEAAARRTAQALLELEPQFTVGAYTARYPGQAAAHAAEYAQALRSAGIPQG